MLIKSLHKILPFEDPLMLQFHMRDGVPKSTIDIRPQLQSYLTAASLWLTERGSLSNLNSVPPESFFTSHMITQKVDSIFNLFNGFDLFSPPLQPRKQQRSDTNFKKETTCLLSSTTLICKNQAG